MFGFPWESIGEIFTKFSFPPPPSLSLRSRWSQRKDAWQAVSEELRREANSKTGSSLLGRPGSLTRTAQLPRARPPAAAAARAPVCKRKSESLPYLGVALESRSEPLALRSYKRDFASRQPVPLSHVPYSSSLPRFSSFLLWRRERAPFPSCAQQHQHGVRLLLAPPSCTRLEERSASPFASLATLPLLTQAALTPTMTRPGWSSPPRRYPACLRLALGEEKEPLPQQPTSVRAGKGGRGGSLARCSPPARDVIQSPARRRVGGQLSRGSFVAKWGNRDLPGWP